MQLALSNNKFISCVSASIFFFVFIHALLLLLHRLTCCLACSSLCLWVNLYGINLWILCIAIQLFQCVLCSASSIGSPFKIIRKRKCAWRESLDNQKWNFYKGSKRVFDWSQDVNTMDLTNFFFIFFSSLHSKRKIENIEIWLLLLLLLVKTLDFVEGGILKPNTTEYYIMTYKFLGRKSISVHHW